MDVSKFPVFRMMTGKIGWLADRQRVLTQNVANSDTPNYRPKDLKQVDFRNPKTGDPFHVALARTHSAHLKRAGAADAFGEERQRDTYETLPTGNAVVLEEQLVKVAGNQQDHALLTQLYRKHIQMFRIALGNRGQ